MSEPTTASSSVCQPGAAGSRRGAAAVCAAWLQAVNTGQIDQLVSLYADDAVLLPTFSSQVLRTPASRRRYFERLARQPGLQVSMHEKTLRVHQTGKVEVATGIYCFRFEIDEVMLSFEARFTFVVDATAARPVLHHHSSQLPRNLA
jgi:hypothetical protein